MILAIDPGKRLIGWALILDTGVHAFGLVQGSAPEAIACRLSRAIGDRSIDVIALEGMIHYATGRTDTSRVERRKAQDLIDVATVGAYVAGRMSTEQTALRVIPAREWKGQAPKHVTELRVRRMLTEHQIEILDGYNATLRHNVIDAIGIGLYAREVMG